MVPSAIDAHPAEKPPARYQPLRIMTVGHLLSRLREALKDAPSKRLRRLIRNIERGLPERDRIMSGLMSIFRDTRSVAIFTLLYELNSKPFLSIIFSNLRRLGSYCDPQDILQEVFISIYRYPRGFREEGEHSFRNWSLSIIRNAIFKHLKRASRHPQSFDFQNELRDDSPAGTPLETMLDKERRSEWRRIYCLSLLLYLHLYETLLKPREKEALHKVEVENLPYRAAAEAMGIKPENFKMVICRARKKIFHVFESPLALTGSRVMKPTG